MSFQNLSVSKKIWSLLLVVMVSMLAASLGTALYVNKVESAIRTSLGKYEQRTLLMTQWQGAVEQYASNALAASTASSMEAITMFEGKNAEVQQRVDALSQRAHADVESDEGRHSLEVVAKARAKMQAAVESVLQERRSDGDVDALVQSDMLPAAVAYVQALKDSVAVQEHLRAQTLEHADQERAMAMTVGGVALLLVIVAGLLVSAWLVRQLTLPLQRAVALADSIAGGDLTQDVHDERKDELGQLIRSLGAMVRKLRTVVGEVRSGVDSVSSAASQIATGNQDLSARTEQTASSLEQTAASMEELTATVTQSADTARQANQLAATAVQAAERGGEVVSQVVMRMLWCKATCCLLPWPMCKPSKTAWQSKSICVPRRWSMQTKSVPWQ